MTKNTITDDQGNKWEITDQCCGYGMTTGLSKPKKEPTKKEQIIKLEEKIKSSDERNNVLRQRHYKMEEKMENYKDKFILYKWLFRTVAPTLLISIAIIR